MLTKRQSSRRSQRSSRREVGWNRLCTFYRRRLSVGILGLGVFPERKHIILSKQKVLEVCKQSPAERQNIPKLLIPKCLEIAMNTIEAGAQDPGVLDTRH